jgi:8-oxo-dGTP pyrophosphatase MutT (NUDIX family)
MAAMLPTSCGTLIVNGRGELLLCHVTGTAHWDIPKGMQDEGESTLAAARRELFEEAGLVLDAALFQDLGSFDYRADKRLHLYLARAPTALEGPDGLAGLVCTSYFPHQVTGAPTPEADGYRWARRDEIRRLCWPKMGARLLALEW